MLEIERTLAARLRERRVGIRVPDGDTVVFRNVPTDRRFFNKARTNLLFKRLRAGTPFVVCVDADIEYRGADRDLAAAFVKGMRREGWRTLNLSSRLHTDLHAAAREALDALGFHGPEPTATTGEGSETRRPHGLLATVGTDLSRRVLDPQIEPTIGRGEEVDEVASCLLRWGQARLCVIAGESGVGKSNLLHAVARRLAQCRRDLRVIRFDARSLLTGAKEDTQPQRLLETVLDEAAAAPDTVLAIEHFELALCLPQGPLLVAKALDNGARIVGTMLPLKVRGFERSPLARRMTVVDLPELSAGEAVAVLRNVAKRLAHHQGVEVAAPCAEACVKAAQTLPGHLPAKAIALLDAAAARAVVSQVAVVGPDEVYFAVSRVEAGGGLEPEPDSGS
jgi:hypothetical protein